MTASFDFSIRAGNSGVCNNPTGIVVRLKDAQGVEEDLTGSEFVFTTSTINGAFLRKTTADTVTVSGGEVTIPISVADSRVFRPGQIVSYEIEQRLGGNERTRIHGNISIVGSVNDDL